MTEVKTRPAQEAWLNDHEIPYTVGRKGGLNVLRAAVVRRHGGDGPPAGTSAPDFTVFDIPSRRHAAKAPN